MHPTGKLIKKKVDEHGFTVLYLLDSDLAYGYTVGLSKFGLPDIVLTGLNQEDTQRFLNIVAEHLIETKQYSLNKRIEGLFNMPVALMPLKHTVDKNERFCRKLEFDAAQNCTSNIVTVVFGDAAGRLFGEEGCDAAWFDMTAAFTGMLN